MYKKSIPIDLMELEKIAKFNKLSDTSISKKLLWSLNLNKWQHNDGVHLYSTLLPIISLLVKEKQEGNNYTDLFNYVIDDFKKISAKFLFRVRAENLIVLEADLHKNYKCKSNFVRNCKDLS